MATACCVCAAVYLALSSSCSLISSDGGIPSSTVTPPDVTPRGARAKRVDEVANGEPHRQEVGVISSGSYQSHFLRVLSDEKKRDEEGEAERREEEKNRQR